MKTFISELFLGDVYTKPVDFRVHTHESVFFRLSMNSQLHVPPLNIVCRIYDSIYASVCLHIINIHCGIRQMLRNFRNDSRSNLTV